MYKTKLEELVESLVDTVKKEGAKMFNNGTIKEIPSNKRIRRVVFNCIKEAKTEGANWIYQSDVEIKSIIEKIVI